MKNVKRQGHKLQIFRYTIMAISIKLHRLMYKTIQDSI